MNSLILLLIGKRNSVLIFGICSRPLYHSMIDDLVFVWIISDLSSSAESRNMLMLGKSRVALDGSQVICHMPPCKTYCSEASFGDIKRSISNHKSLDQDNTAIVAVGIQILHSGFSRSADSRD